MLGMNAAMPALPRVASGHARGPLYILPSFLFTAKPDSDESCCV